MSDREKRPVIKLIKSLGGLSEADPPVPIENTEVKRRSADDTALVTEWEIR